MNQTNHFFNLGYGWLCKHCSAEAAERKLHPQQSHSTVSGNAPQKNEDGSLAFALAGKTESNQQSLTCPRCGIEELI